MLKLNQIKKDYVTGDSTVQALKGIDIEFRENEFVSILGPSGCGKTTLLNIIGGLDRYSEGNLIINGKSTKDFKDKDWDTYRNHSIGFVFQSYNLIPHQTVLANVELALTLSGVSKTERRKRAIDVLERVGLGDQLHKKPNQMSGGQMQRVAIARALINDPDILLADEPTGALDSETSVQIMELLKEISSNKLIIMVTHNPELAEKYSSRIVKLLDGRIIDDNNPYTSTEEDRKIAEVKQKKDKKKGKKTSMSFFTALSLSCNNLLTKKARTFLTSFAGSIGIIGIALILSLSTGVQIYIDQVQEDTLSNYPLEITKTSTDMSKLMSAMPKEEDIHNHDMDKVYSRTMLSDQLNTMFEETKVNNLEKFKKYLDNNEEIKNYTTDIQYCYSTPLYVYKADTSDGNVQVNPSTLLTDSGLYSQTQIDTISSSGMASADVFSEMLENDDVIRNQYDIIAGKYPEKYNEVVLVVDEYNELNDYVLYSLGIMDNSQIKGLMKKAVSGEKIKLDSEKKTFTYDELLDLKFKVVLPTDRYKKDGSKWIDMSEDENFMKKAIANGTELKVVGILRPNKDASATSIKGAIAYRHDLMTYVMDKVEKSDMVADQKNRKDTDIFTGLKFATDKDLEDKNVNVVKSSITSSAQQQEQVEQQEKTQAATSTNTVDPSKMTETQKKYMQTLTDEQLALLQQMQKESEKKDTSSETKAKKTVSDATYDDNLEIMGVANEAKPSTVKIYPKDFASKEHITDIIDEYNNNCSDDDKIEYSDMIGIMMSSVTTIINAIGYILIAFVAISLVVSSIMIGIITYISVLERTKEIGILRSIGASKRDISRVFNAETLIIGLTSGLLGVGISYLLTIPINAIIKHITDIPMRATVPATGAVILVLISMALTLIAGLFPSRIAAKKDPVTALRSE
ncbi:MAG: ATP-binding cassette domain-containing protein [Oscillospiraceae bacterium]